MWGIGIFYTGIFFLSYMGLRAYTLHELKQKQTPWSHAHWIWMILVLSLFVMATDEAKDKGVVRGETIGEVTGDSIGYARGLEDGRQPLPFDSLSVGERYQVISLIPPALYSNQPGNLYLLRTEGNHILFASGYDYLEDGTEFVVGGGHEILKITR